MALGGGYVETISATGDEPFTSLVTASGDYLAVVGSQSSSAVRTYTVGDDKTNTWTSTAQDTASGRIAYGAYCNVTDAGTTIVDVDVTQDGTVAHEMSLWHFTGVTGVDVEPTTNKRASNGTSNPAFASAQVMSDDNMVISATAYNANSGTKSGPTTGTLNQRHVSNQNYHYDNAHTTGLTDDQTHTTNNSRWYVSCTMVFTGDTGGGTTVGRGLSHIEQGAPVNTQGLHTIDSGVAT